MVVDAAITVTIARSLARCAHVTRCTQAVFAVATGAVAVLGARTTSGCRRALVVVADEGHAVRVEIAIGADTALGADEIVAVIGITIVVRQAGSVGVPKIADLVGA